MIRYVCPASVPADDPRSYYEVGTRIAAETPNSIYINQYFNELNRRTLFFYWSRNLETDRRKITHLLFVAGTEGTLSGSAKF